jgi:transposase
MLNRKAMKASKVKSYIHKNQRLQIIYLPPYSPDMNPDEGVWNWSKTKYLVNICSYNVKNLVSNVRKSLRTLQKRKNVLRWCINDSILPL